MSLYLQDLTQALKQIQEKKVNITVIGVGTIGLPLATFLASAGYNVTGLDINEARVRQINDATVVFEYSDKLKKAVKLTKLRATTKSSDALKDAEIIFICVPTPLNENLAMNNSNLLSATDAIIKNIKPGMLIIYESSVSIGTTRTLIKRIEENTKIKIGKDIGVAYCPERYNPTLPGETLPQVVYNSKQSDIAHYTIDKVSRVVGGSDEKSLKLAKTIYSQFITTGVKEVSSIETAEATKLLENIFRDVNIGLVNELATIFPTFGVDVYEVINAAKTKPFAFLPHYPGAGVGGECIPVDTWYLIRQAEENGLNPKLLRVTREVNDSMPAHTVKLLEEELAQHSKKISGSKISVLGLSYKKNIYDTRLSPSLEIVKILKSKGAKVVIYDPIVQQHDSRYELNSFEDTFKNSDALMLITDHDAFHLIDLKTVKDLMKTPIVIDGRQFFNKTKLKSLGFSYRCIGEPK